MLSSPGLRRARLFIGGALSACLGVVIGYLGFRFGLRGFYFVLLTVAFAEICRIVVLNTEGLGGALGLYITFTGNPRQFQFQDNRVYYYVALGLMLGATGIAAWIERHRFGAYLSAIRDDEAASEALGVNTFKYKMLAMIISSFLTGVGGTFYAFYLFSLQPNAVFGIPLSVEIIIRPIVGGGHAARADPRLVHPLALAEVSRAYCQAGGWSGAPPHHVRMGLLIAVVCSCQGAYPFIARHWARPAVSAALIGSGLSKRFGGSRRSRPVVRRDARRDPR